MRQPCVYILASARNGTLYTGVTSDLLKRVWEHKSDLVEGFTKRYGVHVLVWFELHEDMLSAIRREKTIKGWKRRWKIELIETMNPEWRDSLCGAGLMPLARCLSWIPGPATRARNDSGGHSGERRNPGCGRSCARPATALDSGSRVAGPE